MHIVRPNDIQKRRLALARDFYLALAFLFTAGFGMLLFFSTSNTVLQTIVPDEMRGRVMGVRMLAIYGLPLGLLVMGALSFAFIARAPSAFKPDQETNGQRHSETCQRLVGREEGFKIWHEPSVNASHVSGQDVLSPYLTR